MTDYRDVIAAFLDHEPVEGAALERALADPQGREYFVDLMVLRGFVADPSLRLGPIDRSAAGEQKKPGRRSPFWLVAAAALVAAGTTGGYLAGRTADRLHQIAAPPSKPVSKNDQSAGAPAAPAPTHVIRLENGVTWNEKSGGN